MPVHFASLSVGNTYNRHQLAQLWGYKSFQALARGVVTPAGDNKIILFVTNEKQESAEQYRNSLRGSRLEWEGPTDHFSESRILNAHKSGDEIHVFYRDRHHTDFNYLGRGLVKASTLRVGAPSSFTLTFENL